MQWPAIKVALTESRASTPTPQFEKEGRDVFKFHWIVCLSRFPVPRRWGLPFKHRFQCSSPPVVPVARVSPVPKLPWSLQSLPSSRFFLRLGSQPLGSFKTTLPMRPAQAAMCWEHLSPRMSAARARPWPSGPRLLPGGCARAPGTAGCWRATGGRS